MTQMKLFAGESKVAILISTPIRLCWGVSRNHLQLGEEEKPSSNSIFSRPERGPPGNQSNGTIWCRQVKLIQPGENKGHIQLADFLATLHHSYNCPSGQFLRISELDVVIPISILNFHH